MMFDTQTKMISFLSNLSKIINIIHLFRIPMAGDENLT